MKKLILASAAMFSLSFSTNAADLPRRTGAPVTPLTGVSTTSVNSLPWSGFYAGLHAGYVWGDVATWGAREISADTSGWMLGAQAGFNAQFGSIVAGVEGDASWTDAEGRATNGGSTLRADLDWLATLRGRLGFTLDRALVYGTAGFALGDTNYRVASGAVAGSNSDVSTGYAIGAGVEWAFTQNLTAKAEWLYYDLGRDSVVDGLGSTYRVESDGNLARLGLNVKF